MRLALGEKVGHAITSLLVQEQKRKVLEENGKNMPKHKAGIQFLTIFFSNMMKY